MINSIIIAIGGLILYSLILWGVSKIKRRIRAKKNLKANSYMLMFL